MMEIWMLMVFFATDPGSTGVVIRDYPNKVECVETAKKINKALSDDGVIFACMGKP